MRRSVVATTGLVLVVVAAAAVWLLEVRTRADSVGPRFTEALIDRHPGATVESWDAGIMRTALSTGLYVDINLRRVFDTCRAHRFDCSAATERALDDVDRVIALTTTPRAAALQAIVLAEPIPGFRLSFIADPLIGSFETRYALVDGVASTFVTPVIADRLGLTRATLRTTALAALHGDRTPTLVRATDIANAEVFAVHSDADAVASLLDHDRMQRFARQLGSTRLLVAIPARGVLYLAAPIPAAKSALIALLQKTFEHATSTANIGLLEYDLDAPEGANLSSAASPR